MNKRKVCSRRTYILQARPAGTGAKWETVTGSVSFRDVFRRRQDFEVSQPEHSYRIVSTMQYWSDGKRRFTDVSKPARRTGKRGR